MNKRIATLEERAENGRKTLKALQYEIEKTVKQREHIAKTCDTGHDAINKALIGMQGKPFSSKDEAREYAYLLGQRSRADTLAKSIAHESRKTI